MKEEKMSVGEAFQMAGEIYIMGIVIALGMAALIKLICFGINRSELKAASKTQMIDDKGGHVG